MVHKSTSFSLKERDISFISSMVEDGRFGNQTEVIRAGLRLLEDYEHNMKVQRLRADIHVAEREIAEGKGIVVDDTDAFVEDIKRRGRERLHTPNN